MNSEIKTTNTNDSRNFDFTKILTIFLVLIKIHLASLIIILHCD